LQQESRILCQDVSQAVLKIIITRGPGGRGYRPDETSTATRIVGLLPWPDYPEQYSTEGVSLRFCETRLGVNPALAGIKHLNRLEQILASREWQDTEYAEGLMLDQQGNIVEGTRTNLFMIKDGKLTTPDLSQCGVAGIMRANILELACRLGLQNEITTINSEQLLQSDEVFVTNSLIGLWPVNRIEQNDYRIGPVTRQLLSAFESCPENAGN